MSKNKTLASKTSTNDKTSELSSQAKYVKIYLFCSDGLTGMITDRMMSEIFNGNMIDQTTPLFIQQALAHGGDDNVTVLVLNFQDV